MKKPKPSRSCLRMGDLREEVASWFAIKRALGSSDINEIDRLQADSVLSAIRAALAVEPGLVSELGMEEVTVWDSLDGPVVRVAKDGEHHGLFRLRVSPRGH